MAADSTESNRPNRFATGMWTTRKAARRGRANRPAADIGKLVFITLRDGPASFSWARKQLLAAQWEVVKLLDLGDLICGRDARPDKTGELTVWVGIHRHGQVLLQPPEKFHGLENVDLRYRQRYVDLWANQVMVVSASRLP
jgi:lysyl-tRNA synthetase class II